MVGSAEGTGVITKPNHKINHFDEYLNESEFRFRPNSPRRRHPGRKNHSAAIPERNLNNNNIEEDREMLGAAQDQLAPIRLSGHTLDKATKAKVCFAYLLFQLIRVD